MKIFAITKGELDEYHICALTVSRAKAQKLEKIYGGTIEEFEDKRGKEISVAWNYYIDSNEVNLMECDTVERVFTNCIDGQIYGARVYAPNAKQARKKAQEMIARYKAEHAGEL